MSSQAGAIRGGVVRTEDGTKRLLAIRNLEWWREHVRDTRAWAANYEGKMRVGIKRRSGA